MFHPIRHLTDLGHEVHVVAFGTASEAQAARDLSRYCASVEVIAQPRFWQLRGVLGQPPATLAHYFSTKMRRALEHKAESARIDVVELESLHMAAYGGWLTSFARVLRPQNVEHLIWERYAATGRPAPVRALMRIQARRVRRYEARAVSTLADRTLAVSAADRDALRALAPGARVDFLPMGVDATFLTPRPDVPVVPGSIVITGSFDWTPKRHNLAVLVNEVFPMIKQLAPAARLAIVGRGLSGDVLAAVRARNGVDYVGPVDDVRPHIARASVVVNYVESGSGIAIKVLEAMSMGKPVVTNALGAEGIAATSGTHLIVATTKTEFARAVSSLLSDPFLQSRLGAAARELVLEKYASALLAETLVEYFGTMLAT
jgi:glycosyltransferase involved in cell wall biosynthesis